MKVPIKMKQNVMFYTHCYSVTDLKFKLTEIKTAVDEIN